MALALPALLRAQAAVRAGRVHKADHRSVELLRLLHQAQGLAVALRVGRSRSCARSSPWCPRPSPCETTVTGLPFSSAMPPTHGQVVREAAVAVQLKEAVEDVVDVLAGRWAVPLRGRRTRARRRSCIPPSLSWSLQQVGDRLFLLVSRDDCVHKALFQQELRALEALGAACARMVCSMTRGPGKADERACGSARTMSASMAKLAVTPPVVGSVSSDDVEVARPRCGAGPRRWSWPSA